MSLRWIYENCEPPVVDEESSDIDDSCSDDDDYDYDSDVISKSATDNNNYSSNCGPKTRISAILDNGKILREPVLLDTPRNAPGMLVTNNNNNEEEDLVSQPLKLKLFCRTGYYLGIGSSGRVRGFAADGGASDDQVRFILTPVSCGIVRLQNPETGRYLAFNSTGHLYGEPKANKDSTEWEQWKIGKYDSFRSHKYAEAGWWLAIKNNGRHKPGPKTAWAQKATQFVAIRNA